MDHAALKKIGAKELKLNRKVVNGIVHFTGKHAGKVILLIPALDLRGMLGLVISPEIPKARRRTKSS